MVNYILVLHIITISWQSVFRYSDWFPLSILTLLILSFVFIVRQFLNKFNNKHYPLKFPRSDLLIIIGLILMCVNVLITLTSHGGNYMLAYSAIFSSYLVILWFLDFPVNIKMLLRANFIGVNFISSYIIAEVLLRFFYSINLHEIFSINREATATVIPGFYRGYGLSTEPTQVGNYLCSFCPFAIYYARKMNVHYFVFYMCFLIFASLLLFSVASVLILFISFLCFFVLSKEKNKILTRFFYISFIFSLFFIFIGSFSGGKDIILGAIGTLIDKLFLSETSLSANQRTYLLLRGLQDISNYPVLGLGMGWFSSNNLPSNINWYLFFASEAGLIVCFFFVYWLCIQLFNSFLSYKRTLSSLYLVSMVSIFSGMLYLLFISTFQNLFLLSSILVYRLIKRHNEFL